MEIKKELPDALLALQENIDRFTEDELNRIPFEGSWTAGQVADHIMKSQEGVFGLMRGKTAPSERDPGEYIEGLKAVFMDFTTKLKSPDFVLPSTLPVRKKDLLERIEKIQISAKEIFSGLDLSEICLEFVLPDSPPMTRLEWSSFLLFHTLRHNRQIRNIETVLAGHQEKVGEDEKS